MKERTQKKKERKEGRGPESDRLGGEKRQGLGAQGGRANPSMISLLE
jgi:hypothetical protein